jgi:hypothetical protein
VSQEPTKTWRNRHHATPAISNIQTYNTTVGSVNTNAIFVLPDIIVLIQLLFPDNANLVSIQKLDGENACLVKMVISVNSKRRYLIRSTRYALLGSIASLTSMLMED